MSGCTINHRNAATASRCPKCSNKTSTKRSTKISNISSIVNDRYSQEWINKYISNAEKRLKSFKTVIDRDYSAEMDTSRLSLWDQSLQASDYMNGLVRNHDHYNDPKLQNIENETKRLLDKSSNNLEKLNIRKKDFPVPDHLNTDSDKINYTSKWIKRSGDFRRLLGNYHTFVDKPFNVDSNKSLSIPDDKHEQNIRMLGTLSRTYNAMIKNHYDKDLDSDTANYYKEEILRNQAKLRRIIDTRSYDD